MWRGRESEGSEVSLSIAGSLSMLRGRERGQTAQVGWALLL